MKKKLTALALSLLSVWTFSQTRYSDQSMLAFGGGATGKKGYYAQLSYSRFIGEQGWLGRADLIYLNQKAYIKNIAGDKEINLTQYLLMPMAQYDFENLNVEPFYLSVFGGAVVGYEIVNKGKDTLPISGVRSEKLKNNFIYGANLGVQGEVELGRHLSAYASAMEMFRMNSHIGKFSFMLGVGFKYYF